jgi:hypothetical protein
MLERGGAFRTGAGPVDINASHVTPGDLVKAAVWQEHYHQLAGRPGDLRDYNALPVREWRRAILTR